jgi:hydrogenase/urease accessory protein HupE
VVKSSSVKRPANIAVIVVGVVLFGVLMALREMPHSTVARTIIAAAAGVALGVVIKESRRSRRGAG